MWDVYAFLITFLTCTGYAAWRGGAPERVVAIAFVIAIIASGFASSSSEPFGEPETGILIVDILLFISVLPVAMRAERFWPIWMAALLGFGVLLQLAYLVGPSEHRRIYQTLAVINAWPSQLLIALATWRHRQRLTLFGNDKAWSNF